MEQLASLSTLRDARVQLERCYCFALMQYLNSGLEKACEVFDRLISLFETLGELDNVNCELTYIAYPLFNILVVTKSLVASEKFLCCIYLSQLNPWPHNTYVKLIYQHMNTSTLFQPRVLRNVLERALSIFSSNVIFLSLYLANEERSKIAGRVRSQLDMALAR